MAKVGTAADGRRMRSVRTKQAILKACVELLKSGQLVPTAQMIADQAGVPIRSFFRHFPDMESLFGSLDESLKPKYERIFKQDLPEGGLSARVDETIEMYCRLYKEMAPIIKATKAMLWRYETLCRNYKSMVKVKRIDMERRIPELKEIDHETRELIHGLSSFEMWERLREYQNIAASKTVKIIAKSVNANLTEALKN